MRMQRFVAIVLIAVANIFILVHAGVPHFHHDGIVCFDAKTETDCKTCHTYGETEDCCHENIADNASTHHGHLDSCDLAQIVERDGNPSDDAVTILPALPTDLVCICSFHCYDFLALADLTTYRFERYKPYQQTYNSPYIGSSFGLRAPPTPSFL